jgi:hypothetical protein
LGSAFICSSCHQTSIVMGNSPSCAWWLNKLQWENWSMKIWVWKRAESRVNQRQHFGWQIVREPRTANLQ